MAGLVFGKGLATLEVSPGLQRHVEHMLRQAAPRTMAAITHATDDLAEDARTAFPRKTGAAADGIGAAVRLVGVGIVEGVVFGRVPYTYVITLPTARAWDRRAHAWTEYVRKPGVARTPALARALAADMLVLARTGG